MPVSDAEIKKAFAQAVTATKRSGRIPAMMGKPTGVGTWAFDAPGSRGLKYVQIEQGAYGKGIAEVVNEAGIADTGDLKIWLEYEYGEIGGRLIITGERFDG